ncbi:restriction endonuclease subunit S [Campylobacter lari]|uniref:restriction endonuclease subunit S n=1 Tax=Campylobacter lari TaxID=201 RepID=UPI00214A68DC|nr:restriction endonuclease subunit S [Campylobacter lari]MCR2080433.1 restriction endonuclease subunit S [Campylobacter lari subsp. concheus]
MMNCWEVKRLGDIGFFIRGVSYKKEQLLSTKNENSVYLLRANNIQNELNLDELQIIPKELVVDKIIQNNDILFAMSSGSKHIVGKNILLNNLNDFTFGAFCGLFRIINLNICHKFIAYYLRSDSYKNYIFNISKGSNINNLRFIDLEKFQIPLPPLQEQERIVGILDESFAKIDESIKILEQDLLNLDELIQSALQKAFNPLKDNAKENYKLPQGWEWKSLGEICFITDGTHKTPNYIKTGIPFLSVKNISKGFFDLSDIKYISLEEHNKLIKRAKPEFGDILICRIGTLGKAIKISLDFEFSIFVSLGLLKPKIKIISDYLVYFLNSYFIEGWIDNNKVGGGTHTAKLNLNILEKCPIALPSLKEQEQIVSYLDELSLNIKDLKQNYQMQIKNLQELKKSLLDKAFQGRL